MALKPVRVDIVGRDRTAKSFATVERRVANLRRAVVGVGSLLGLTFGAAAIKNQLNYADAIGKTSRQLGTTAEFLSEAAAAGKLAGIEFRTLSIGMQRMTRRVAEAAAGSSEFGKAFETLGINARALRSQSLDVQFETILTALRGINEESERVRLAQKIFDSEGVVIARLAENFKELKKEGRDAGSTITTEFSLQAAVLNDQVTKAIERVNRGLRGSIGFVFQLAEGLALVAARMVGLNNITAIDQLGAKITETEEKIRDMEAALAFAGEAGNKHLPNNAAHVEAITAKLVALRKELAGYTRDLADLVDKPPAAPARASKVTIPAPFATSAPGKDRDRTHGLLGIQIERAFLSATKHLEKLSTTADTELDKVADAGHRATSELEYEFSGWLQRTETGIQGLGQTFAVTLRGMVARALASKLFQLVFPQGSKLLSIPAPGRASGGPVSAGRAYTVGERGPELFIPNTGGQIMPNGAGGSVHVVNNIDARGADPSLVNLLPKILEDNRQRTEQNILRLIKERRILT